MIRCDEIVATYTVTIRLVSHFQASHEAGQRQQLPGSEPDDPYPLQQALSSKAASRTRLRNAPPRASRSTAMLRRYWGMCLTAGSMAERWASYQKNRPPAPLRNGQQFLGRSGATANERAHYCHCTPAAFPDLILWSHSSALSYPPS